MNRKTAALLITSVLLSKVLFAQSYEYTFDLLPLGPNQGDSGQPRGDEVPRYSDESGIELLDGNVPVLESEDGWVGFNEYCWSGTGYETGDPQPRIVFDMGRPMKLQGIEVTYLNAGGYHGIIGPMYVDIYFGRTTELWWAIYDLG